MTMSDDVKVEVTHEIDQSASENFGENMYRGRYTIRKNGEPVAHGRTMAAFVQASTAEISARVTARKLIDEMFGS
jgi:hypothetical protein